MYKRIYECLEEKGIVKSAVALNGSFAGSRCICEDGKCIPSEEGISARMDWMPYENIIGKTEETAVVEQDGTELLVEIFRKNPRLIILGGGHVSCPVAKIGKMLGFCVTVMDDRRDFLTEERFPDADERILGSFEELSEKIPPYENAYYVVVTRGHQGDSLCARQILRRPYVYFGMIGSKTKVRLTREKLLNEGFTPAQLDSIHAPIGLPIGGQLPEEIAVSIMAEIVQTKNAHYTAFTDERVAQAVLEGNRGTMLTIIKKSGSSPRGTGSKMFVCCDGTVYGSIGGGSVEYEAVKHAMEGSVEYEAAKHAMEGSVEHEAVKHAAEGRETEIQRYDLSISDDRNLGMICGGKVEVLFEKI
ncbi:MAG: XdhC family protein [Eubacteriales bacterium]|nr:XdhC family protein [Eubacteriales bacterium]